MNALSEERKGESYIFLGVILWGFFPVVTVLTYAQLGSLVSLGWSTLLATLFFGLIVLYRKTWRELLNPLLWKYGLYIAFFIGVLFYAFYFVGLEYTTPGNAAIIVLFEVFTTFLFFRVLRGERISLEHRLGAVLIVLGAGIVLAPNFLGFNIGDFLVLAGTLCTPVGNYFQQEARKFASSETILFLRSLLAAVAVFVLAYALGQHSSVGDLRAALPLLIVNGILLLGLSKILWIEGIHRISVTKAIALGNLAPALTLLVAWAILSQVPTLWQLLSLPPLALGTLLLTDQLMLKRR